MSLTFARESEIVLLVGNRRKGKTFNQRGMLHWQGERYPWRRHIILDHLSQFALWELKGDVYHHADGSLPIQHTVIYESLEQFRTHFKRLFWEYRYHVIRSPEITPEITIRAALWAGGCNLWIDEIDAFASKSAMIPELNEVVQRGAHAGSDWFEGWEGHADMVGCGWGGRGVSLVCAVRRMEEVHNSIIAGATTICSVYSDLVSSNKRMALEVGQDATSLDKQLRSLRAPHMLRFDTGQPVVGLPDIWVLDRLTDPKRRAQNGRNGNCKDGGDRLEVGNSGGGHDNRAPEAVQQASG